MLDDLLDDVFDALDSIESVKVTIRRGEVLITDVDAAVGETRSVTQTAKGQTITTRTRDYHIRSCLYAFGDPKVGDVIEQEIDGRVVAWTVRKDDHGDCFRHFDRNLRRLRIFTQER